MSTSPVLSAYIPMDRRQALARGATLPDRTTGAALFADISGFTPLTEALAAELGPRRGAEELTRQLNVIYSGLIAEVDRYHGSVIGFAGDAITCWFDENKDEGGRRKDEEPSSLTPHPSSFIPHLSSFRAVACALAMQQAMQRMATVTTPSGNTISLAIKVAITAGPARRFLVGDPRIQYVDALAGDTLARLAATEHHAEKGEVVVSPEVIDNLGEATVVQTWREPDEHRGQRYAVVRELTRPVDTDPWPELPADALSDEQVRPWLLPDMKRIGQEQFLAELRPATALFLRFGGIDYDRDEDAGEKLDAFIRWAQRSVARYEGSLLQVTIGDKGSYFYGAFGAPLAHDDDPARAVAAALELRAPPPELAFIDAVHIGISQGRMRVGPYGSMGRRTYGVLGDEVNMAARLMSQAAPGQVLISQRVANVVGRHYTLRPLGPIAVKGKREPVQVSLVIDRHAPAAQHPTALYSGPLVGREAELSQAARWLEQAHSGAGQVIRLEGAAGIGKSHLAAEIVDRAAARGMRVATGVCQSTLQDTAYTPWQPILHALIGLDGESETGEQSAQRHITAVEAFVAQTNRDWLLRLPLLGDLLGLKIPDNATTAAFEPKLRQSALFDLVVEMCERWSKEQPLLLLLDDAHWMDEASKGLTLALARALADMPLLLVLAHRPSRQDRPVLPELSGLAVHHALTLGELSPHSVASLVDHRLAGPISPLALSLIQAETQGNPFFVEEVIDALRESGNLHRQPDGPWALSDHLFNALKQANYLARSDDAWVLAPDASLSTTDLGLPDSIQGAVLSRIDRLPEGDKLTLKIASVVGRIFELGLVALSHPVSPDAPTLLSQMGTLETRDLVHPEAPPPRTTYLFKHNVTREVAYDTLLFDQRRQLHRAVAKALERVMPAAITQLAYHAFVGEDWGRALHYQIAAGEHAQKLFANQEAIEHFRKALQCAQQLAPEYDTAIEQQRIHAHLGELLATTGQPDLALEHLGHALWLAVALGERDAQASACRWTAYVHEHRAEYAQALDWIQRGLQALGDRQTAAMAELYAIAGLIHNRQGDTEQALAQCERAIQVAEQTGALQTLAFAHNSRALVSYARGDSADAIEHHQQAVALYQQADDIQGQAMSYNGIGNSYFNMGRWTEADRHLRRAREIFIQTGDELHRVFANNNLGGIALGQGRLDDALAFYRDALRVVERLGGSAYVKGALHLNLGATLVRQGEAIAARQHLRAAQELFAQAESRDFLSELHRVLAEAALLAGEPDEAETYCRRALDLAREGSLRGEEGNALRVLGEIALAQADAARAGQHLGESVRILEEIGHGYELARSRLSLARACAALGEKERGRPVLAECLATLEELGAALDLEAAQRLQAQLAV